MNISNLPQHLTCSASLLELSIAVDTHTHTVSHMQNNNPFLPAPPAGNSHTIRIKKKKKTSHLLRLLELSVVGQHRGLGTRIKNEGVRAEGEQRPAAPP